MLSLFFHLFPCKMLFLWLIARCWFMMLLIDWIDHLDIRDSFLSTKARLGMELFALSNKLLMFLHELLNINWSTLLLSQLLPIFKVCCDILFRPTWDEIYAFKRWPILLENPRGSFVRVPFPIINIDWGKKCQILLLRLTPWYACLSCTRW